MTDYLVDTEVLNIVEVLNGVGDTLLVTSTGSLIDPIQEVIQSLNDGQVITVDGLVYGDVPILLNANNTAVVVNGTLQGAIGPGLEIFAPSGATTPTTNNDITVGSAGIVEGNHYGIVLSEPVTSGVLGPATGNTVTNSGTIQSIEGGVGIETVGDGLDVFNNSGKIMGIDGMYLLDNSNVEGINNSGTIEGTTGPAITSIVDRGT
jgi:hypothetical protein